jgi:hypothetical protein
MFLQQELESLPANQENDRWSYIWGSGFYSVSKAYAALSRHTPTHQVFSLLWSSKCQPKYIVFFWLLLQDKLNTRDRLPQRHMTLESYVCENCILQRRETVYHLFLRCSFARNYWNSIGVVAPIISYPQRAVFRLKRQIHNQCAMEIVMLMAWCI